MKKKFEKTKDLIVGRVSFFRKLDEIFVNNPVVIQGLALTPIIMAATSLKNGVALSLALFIIYPPVILFARYFSQKIQLYLRELCFVVVASLAFVFASKMVDLFDATAAASVGIYLPLLVVDGLIIVKGNAAAENTDSFLVLLKKALYTLLGFTMVALCLGAIREFLAYGTLWDLVMIEFGSIPTMTKAYMGFILIGLIAAVNQLIANYMKKELNMKEQKGEKENGHLI